MAHDFHAVVPAPFGAVGILASDDFVIALSLLTEPQAAKVSAQPFVQHVASKLQQYFRDPAIALDIAVAVNGTAFQKRVWRAIAAIPVGKTMSYGELARTVGSGARAVANACGANRVPLLIPCHRVVAQSGLGGFMQGKMNGLSVKQWLLEHEQAHA